MSSHLQDLWAAHAAIEAQILAEQARIAEEHDRAHPQRIRRSRHDQPPHGTEQAYQRHRRLGDYCDPCRAAHKLHERERARQRTEGEDAA